ncbi:MAG TPA: DUF6141 family protein [Puia sp.]|nr:DUF6141 family protein [Puia sp.]
MGTQTFFSEKQRFRQTWLWIILIALDAYFLFAVFKRVIGKNSFGDKPMSNEVLLFTIGTMLFLPLFFYILRLDTEINSNGIYIRFFPFHLSYKKYAWDEIEACFVRQYNPIAEYGGWGIRLGLFGKGRAFNVSGNKGIQLVFKNDKKLLIGTSKPEEALEAIKKAGHPGT